MTLFFSLSDCHENAIRKGNGWIQIDRKGIRWGQSRLVGILIFIHSLCLFRVSPTYPNMHSEEGRETPCAGQTRLFEVY